MRPNPRLGPWLSPLVEGRWFWILVVVAALAVLGLARRAVGSRASPEAARRAVDEGALLLDVRTAGEYGSGHIAGAKNIPVQELARRKGELPDGDRSIVVYCASGMRSARAKRMLESWGYPHVIDLGPMTAWPR